MFHRVAGDSGSRTHRGHTNKGNDNGGGDDREHLHTLSQSMSPVPFAEDSNEVGGLQGLSPGSGQGTYAAQFRSPCPHSHQSAVGIECSTGSILDATSPRCGGVGVGGSILSPGVDSVETASSLWMCEEEETACVWNNGGESVSWRGGGDQNMEGEGDSKAKDWQEGEEKRSGHGQRQLGLLDGEDGRVDSASPKDARCSSSGQDQGPATR